MPPSRASRLNWNTIGSLAFCFALLLGIGYVVSLDRARSPTTSVDTSGHDDRPLDFADAYTRHAFARHQEWMKMWKLASVPDSCGDEFYRVYHEPGLGDDKFRMVEVHVAGRRAVVTEFAFGRVWHLAWEGALDEERIDSVRSALSAVLKADIRPAIGYGTVDASSTVVETCRRDRYHFFQRSTMDSSQAFESDTPDTMRRLSTLANAILRLPEQARDRSSASANASAH